jgi:hypothetical protein
MEIMIKLAVILFLFLQTTRQEGCNITLFQTWDSVVISSESFEILYPPVENAPDDRNITLPVGATIIISCNGGHFSGSFETTKTILATCNQDFRLEVQDTILDYDKLDCVNFKSQIAKTTSTSCGPNAIIIEVGFQIGLNIRFLPQMVVCFDTKNQIPLYTHYNMTKSIGFIKSYLQTTYVTDAVFNPDIDFDAMYNFTHEQQEINKLLGLPADSTKYVAPLSCRPPGGAQTPGFCFTPRQLTDRGSFVYIPQQQATFRYINVAPQWYFLDYNLNKLERNVVDYVKTNKLDLEVYTGTFGVASYPHEITGEDVALFMYVSGSDKAVPVPLIFWKLVYDAVGQRATVFLTVDDPYQSDVSKNVICDDVSDGIGWLTWEKHNVTKGYSYACAYEDAKKTISYLPDIIVKEILV